MASVTSAVHFANADGPTLRAVDDLIARLLREIQIDLPLSGTFLRHAVNLKRVLMADYRRSPVLASKELLRQLARVVENEIRPNFGMLSASWNTRDLVDYVTATYGPREIEVRAQPYRHGAGLALRGFFCHARLSAQRKFLIFLNTAHIPIAVAATFGHELGHYIYASIVGEGETMGAWVEGDFTSHLAVESEFFADSLVALAAYDRTLIQSVGAGTYPGVATSAGFLRRFKQARELVDKRFNFAFPGSEMKPTHRVRYLTSMIHFFKLRRVLLHCADL